MNKTTMTHVLAAALVVLALGAAGDATATTTVLLDMSTDPVLEGWTVLQGGGGFHAISSGLLAISAPSYYEFDAPAALWDATVNNADGWIFEA